MTDPYEDILNLPHHVSDRRPRMPMRDRAAQFAPFAVLTGYGEAIEETGRQTDRRIEIGEDRRNLLDRKHAFLSEHLGERPLVSVTYFVQDPLKPGGRYVTATGRLKRIDAYARQLELAGGERIPVDDVLDIRSDLFPDMFE